MKTAEDFPPRIEVELPGARSQKAVIHVRRDAVDSLEFATSALRTEFGYTGEALTRNERKIPVWPKGYVGSITHKTCSDEAFGYWATLVAPRTEEVTSAGVDLERVMKPSLIEKLVRSRGDRWSETLRQVKNTLGHDDPEAWTTLFSIFEVGVKCLGNAGWIDPLIPENFELARIDRDPTDPINPTENCASFSLLVPGHRRRIDGAIRIYGNWTLSHGFLRF